MPGLLRLPRASRCLSKQWTREGASTHGVGEMTLEASQRLSQGRHYGALQEYPAVAGGVVRWTDVLKGTMAVAKGTMATAKGTMTIAKGTFCCEGGGAASDIGSVEQSYWYCLLIC